MKLPEPLELILYVHPHTHIHTGTSITDPCFPYFKNHQRSLISRAVKHPPKRLIVFTHQSVTSWLSINNMPDWRSGLHSNSTSVRPTAGPPLSCAHSQNSSHSHYTCSAPGDCTEKFQLTQETKLSDVSKHCLVPY